MAVRRLARLTREELSHRTGDVLVLPLGSTEQHGPHLPLCTDMLLAHEVAEAASERVASGLDVVLAPGLAYGVSPHHVFAGAASLRPATYQRVLDDLLDSLAASGFRRFFLLNGHGGNHDSLGVTAKAAPLRHGICVGVCSYWQAGAGRLDDLGLVNGAVPGHAGVFETSLVLALDPEVVRMDQAPTRAPDPAPLWASSPHVGLDVQVPGEWQRVDGYSDPSQSATAALGGQILERTVVAVAEAIAGFAEVTAARARVAETRGEVTGS